MVSPGQKNIPELDGVRGTACIFIILLHCLIGIVVVQPGSLGDQIKGHFMPFLIGGVDMFFVLSGFLIGGILLDNRDADNYFKAFWVRRIARILPVNYALLASFVLVTFLHQMLVLPQLDIWLLKDPMPLWTYATFTQSIPMAIAGEGGPRWLGITWSLAIEEQFYLLFPLVVFFFSRRSIVLIAMAAIVVAPVLYALIEWQTGRPYSPYVLLPCRMSALFLGVLVACIVRHPRALAISRRVRVLLDVVILLIVYSIVKKWLQNMSWEFREEHRLLSIFCNVPLQYLITSVLFALLILRIFLYENGLFRSILRLKFLTGAGLISYALYMYHQAVNGLLHGFILNQEPRIASVTDFLVAMVVVFIAVGLATLSYFYLERPIRQLGHRVRYKHASSPSESLPASARWANFGQPPQAVESLDPSQSDAIRQRRDPAV